MSDLHSIFKVLLRPRHSHSIVSATCKRLKIRDFFTGLAEFTVKSTARNFRLRAIEGDRCRMALGALAAMRREEQLMRLYCRERPLYMMAKLQMMRGVRIAKFGGDYA